MTHPPPPTTGSPPAATGQHIHITGVVQGVGFRPFVYGLAMRLALPGRVSNTSAGVDIDLDGPPDRLAAFVAALQHEAPPLARIDELRVTPRPVNGFTHFEIIHSQPIPGAFQPISPDVSLCADCRRELFDPADRRYRYPFINCTNCGPRFTIIQDIPYDRPATTMAPFPLCPTCAAEYQDPLDRRFHAQPVACPTCGPHLWLELGDGHPVASHEAALQSARQLLARGRILAIKGLGGFHLACDATNALAVAELRRRKLRVDKPFALMLPDLAAVERFCLLNDAERALLTGRERPIVILQQRPGTAIAAECAPGRDTLGIMLPYTPLHELLLEPAPGFPPALVMTSGNLSEEPIATGNAEARDRLAPLADAFLLHNRDIHVRCDDSVVQVAASAADGRGHDSGHTWPAAPSTFLRRARGYAPFPITLPRQVPPLLATGAELKNTFCLANGRYAFVSQHIGDLANYETWQAFTAGVTHFERLFHTRPGLIAYDLHPDYLATRYALERAAQQQLPAVGVQHHHAHIAACLADNGLPGSRPVIGVSFDGTGYGPDGAIWGGEFLIADYAQYERPYHLAYVPLPGGDLAAREPWRMALAWLHHAGLAGPDNLPPQQFAHTRPGPTLQALRHQLSSGLNAPPTASMGRLFDAVAALIGLRQVVNYEAQAAIELETLARTAPTDNRPPYPFTLNANDIDAAPLIAALVQDWQDGVPAGVIANRFHHSLAQMVHDVCQQLRRRYQLTEVALSGGVWQNSLLTALTLAQLHPAGFTVYIHRQLPANDGGLALGQAIIAATQTA